jgi:hypothetical protein
MKSSPTPVTVACGCNKTPQDDSVITEPQYGFLANLTLLFGVTAAPKRIDFRCLDCGKVIGSTDDAAQIKRHTH